MSPRSATGAALANMLFTLRQGKIVEVKEYADTLLIARMCNNHRLFGPIENIPPAAAETNYYAKQQLDMVA